MAYLNKLDAFMQHKVGEMTKQNKKCMKCGAQNLVRIPVMPGAGQHIAIGDRLMQAIAVMQFVCGTFGFIERWVAGEDDLAKLRKQYGNKKQSTN